MSRNPAAVRADRIEKLTEGQRVCLRLVYDRLTSKDIARELGISPHTVDQRLRQAIELLGVQSRVDAARALAAFENNTTYQSLIYQPPHIAAGAGPAPVVPSDTGDRWRDTAMVGEEQAPYLAFATSQPRSFIPPLPVRRGDRNDLTPLQRLGWTIAITVMTALSAGVFLTGIEALGKLAWSAKQTLS